MARAKKAKVTADDLKKPKKSKVKKPRDIRSMFREILAEILAEGGVLKVKKDWMRTKAFDVVDTPEALQEWVSKALKDAPKFKFYDHESIVAALDTETLSLDTRLFVRMHAQPDGSYKQTYEIKTDIGGICLSVDGVKGIYIPINHEFQDIGLTTPAKNMDRKACADILQPFFDQVHLVFYNAKYDREILRLTMGITFRDYPFFEDVQCLQYINDPKADMEDKKFYTGDTGGLKALSKNVLGIDQIELDEIAKVKAETCPITGSPFCACMEKQKEDNKHGLRNHFAPFSWVPVELALYYAASDAICTWLLWEKLCELARSRRTAHRIDHELVDSIAWIERQRFIIDTERHRRTVMGHQKKLAQLEKKLYDLAIAAGYQEPSTDEGEVMEKDKFNPGSNDHLRKLFFDVKKYKVTKMTDGGKKGVKKASCDAEVVDDLFKEHPDDEFLSTLSEFKDYQALHPSSLRYDPSDSTARIYLKQNIVAGGRLSSAGGDFYKDGGFGLNSQAVKKVEGYLMWKVTGNILSPDEIPEDQIEEHAEEELHPSCFQEKDGKRTKAPGIIKNHIGQYMGYAVCLVPGCKTCREKFGVIIENGKIDANEVVNLRCLFHAPPGYTFFTVDYGNIEMRAAANCSGEPEFIKEFLQGKGDFHSLTASKVFPEFNDPNISKAEKKRLRDLAKIINFALLYGGTEYTIYENMKKQDPNITRERAKEMVDNYWAGVPVFFQYVQMKQAIARDKLICTTTTGRVINFKSAMEALHIHVPSDEENKNLWKYRDLMRQSNALKDEGDPAWKELSSLANGMWRHLDTGVRNAIDYQRFMSKIQRVAVNAPIQGLCGDFMRMSLNKIRHWVESDPLVATVLILHCSVHDEIDFCVKDEYVPFVLPRITRIMKLRRLHEKLKWPVPIEADAEYGRSWDVEHHVTGDDDHLPAGWTRIPGIATYLPPDWDADTVRNLIKAILSGDEKRIAKAEAFLKENLHERAYAAAWHAFWSKDRKKGDQRQADRKEVQRALIAALQLDEYWRIDNVSDDDDKMETFAQYEERNGLGPADRNPAALPFGPLGSLPLDAPVTRFKPEPLNVVIPPPGTEHPFLSFSTPEGPQTPPEASGATEGTQGTILPSIAAENALAVAPDPSPSSVPAGKVLYALADLDDDQFHLLDITLGTGDKDIYVSHNGVIHHLPNHSIDYIPERFRKND
jgi:DNA polymerase I-like protein with 3'-5' exonuclease and polymerase domains